MTDKILKFSASYCQPCKILAKNLEGVDLGVPVEEVDIGEQFDFAKRFVIRSVPTLIYMRDDTEISRKVGNISVKQIEEWIASISK